jgi:hypothetical protein
MFGEESGGTNHEWKRKQKGKRRVKRLKPSNQLSDGSSGFGHYRFSPHSSSCRAQHYTTKSPPKVACIVDS